MKTWPKTMKTSSIRRATVLVSALSAMLGLGSGRAYGDDFGNIVHHIEARYQVHRNHRFILGVAGLAVKVWHVAGVKNVKIALFENQRLRNSGMDKELDEIVQRAGGNGWQPMVRSYSRRSGEHTFIYAKDTGAGKNEDLQLLVVSVQPSEAVVVQVKVNPDKLFQVIDGDNVFSSGRRHKKDRRPQQDRPAETELASVTPADWDGTCLPFSGDPALWL
ncbi:MAG: hypothetical protein LAO20_06325 [Acidobacteriia bacterium]|nr:hypothetical protein [Terriglobia bacterium]